MKKYLVAAILFLANSEVVSWIALCAMAVMFIWDMAGWTAEGKW